MRVCKTQSVRRSDGFEIRRQKKDLTSLGSADLQSAASKIANPAEHLTRVLLQANVLYISNRIATFFILSPIFSCEIKIFIVSLQNEEEDKKEKRGGPENKKVDQKGGPETRNVILQVFVNKGSKQQKILYKIHLNSRICAAIFYPYPRKSV